MFERVVLRSRVNELFTQSRSAAGSRSIMLMMKEDGMQIGRFKVRKLMSEMGLISKQPGSHAYKGLRTSYFTATRAANTVAAAFVSGCGVIASNKA